MTSTASPSFPRGIATVGYSTDLPADYRVFENRFGCDVYWSGRLISSGHESYADACWFAQEHAQELADEQADADEAAAEAAYEDELERLHALVNAQGGVPAAGNRIEAARVRAVQTVLDLIDGLATKAA